MQHFIPRSGLRLVSTNPPNRQRAQRHEREEKDEARVAVDSFEHDANVSDQFHPVGTPQLGRDDRIAGGVAPAIHPGSELCHHGSARALQFPLAVPPAQICADARQVVANPEQYADRPLLRRLAWMMLMTSRGCDVDQIRLAQMPVEMAR